MALQQYLAKMGSKYYLKVVVRTSKFIHVD